MKATRGSTGSGARPRVLFIELNQGPGGAELHVLRYLRSPLRTLDVEVVTMLRGETFAGMGEVKALEMTGFSKLDLLRAALRLAKMLSRSEADVVVCNEFYPLLLASLVPKFRKRLVLFMRSAVERSAGQMSRVAQFRRNLAPSRVLSRRADAVLANSEWTLTTAPKGLRKKPSYIVHPISGELGSAADTPIQSHGLRVLSLSRFEPYKGLHLLVEAMKMAESRGALGLSLTMAGHGNAEYRQRLEDELSTVSFPWSILQRVADVSPLVRAADVIACPSTDPEPFGQVIVQGLSAGRLVIASRAGGASEILAPTDAGRLVTMGDVDELADALTELARLGPTDRQRLSQEARQRGNAFNDESTISEFESAVIDIATKGGRSR